MHRIEQRHEKPFVQEVPKKSQLESGKLIEEVDPIDVQSNISEKFRAATARYSVVSTRDGTKLVVARIPVWQCEIGKVSLSVISEDCLCVTGEDGQDIVNVNLMRSVDPQKAKALFNKNTKILTVLLPLL